VVIRGHWCGEEARPGACASKGSVEWRRCVGVWRTMCLVGFLIAGAWGIAGAGAAEVEESEFYRIVTYAVPEELKLEASGLAVMPDGRLAVSIRKGEVWIIENPTADAATEEALKYSRFASGLHEPLGLAWHDGALYTTQRSEVTRLEDGDGDGVADAYLTVAKGWGVSGNYHEYAYGPVFDGGGNLWITLNTTIGTKPELAGHRATENPWRGWSMMMRPGGKLEPVSCGLRSPCGLGVNAAGDVFATDQQGNWWGTNPLLHLKKGVFHGHADALADTRRAGSPVKHPGTVPQGLTVAQAMVVIPGYEPPAVWFPYDKMGQSTTGLACDLTKGKFGPFEEQFFVGEFTQAFVSRVFLEKVEGEYQGACFHFRRGFQSAVLSLEFLPDGSLAAGESNRGWNSLGTRSYGLERLVWTGEVPFEVKTMEAQADGFRLTFTKAVDVEAAASLEAYALTCYTYTYHQQYGSEEIDAGEIVIRKATVAGDGMSVRLVCEGLRAGYVHELHLPGMRSAEGEALLHGEAYYTLNRIPGSR
jgi:glucose/arabinose dehydrogenase